MTLDYKKLKNWPHKEIEHTYTQRDTMLYALGIGLGGDPLDLDELKYVYEDGLQPLPTMGAVLASPGFWLKDPETGIDWKQILHGEQNLEIHKPLPVAGTVVARMEITEIYDKGAGKGAVMYNKREIRDKKTGELYCTVGGASFLRGNGGFEGGPTTPAPQPKILPDRTPDLSYDAKTLPRAALIYRLSGDYNPLHADPAVAKAGGFPMPILHGLCTYGNAGYALVRLVAGNDPSRLRKCNVRFSSPVFPGETIRTEVWKEGGSEYLFRCRVVERDKIVLTAGHAVVH